MPTAGRPGPGPEAPDRNRGSNRIGCRRSLVTRSAAEARLGEGAGRPVVTDGEHLHRWSA